jgi:hypothetical protein
LRCEGDWGFNGNAQDGSPLFINDTYILSNTVSSFLEVTLGVASHRPPLRETKSEFGTAGNLAIAEFLSHVIIVICVVVSKSL